MNQYIICNMRGAIYSFLFEDGRAVEIHCDRPEQESILGNIYVGRIRDIAKNIGAAFVEIAPDVVCYLPLDEVQNPIYVKKGTSAKPQQGDELLVQVSREAIKTKYASVTTNLTLHGKYLLLTTGNTQIHASAKLGKMEKLRLIGLVKELKQEYARSADANSHKELSALREDVAAPDRGNPRVRKYGWLVRTNAEETDRAVLRKDMERLLALYQSLIQEGTHRMSGSCVLSVPHRWLSRLSDLYDSSTEQFLTDDEELFREMRNYLSVYQPEDLPKLIYSPDAMQPLYKKYSLEKQLDDALSEHVWLKSGGYLVIQPTEALTVIDVNTGKYEGSQKNRQKAFFKINCEAAAEAARQIRLRNLSGIILIDFINMDAPEDNKELLDELENLLRQDPVRTTLVDMTKLSLVEITRMKKEKPLSAQVLPV
ncbi:MAG: ribonuclease E/G [Lachnospiraceae bacterium]|nr:ribonuclease E/G [Lachnospiraceae bacterium]